MSLLSTHGRGGWNASAQTTKSGSAVELTLAKMPQIDHRIRQSFKCMAQLSQALEPQQQTSELILSPNTRSMVWNRSLKRAASNAASGRLAVFLPRGFGIDVRDHATIENRFAINPAIVDALEADNCSFKIKADSIGDAYYRGQGFP